MPLPVRITVAIAAIVVCSCGGEDCPPVTGEPRVTLGTGDIEYEDLADGDDIWVIQGPQGGYHLLGSVRMGGICPGNPDDVRDSNNPTVSFAVSAGGVRIDKNAANFQQGLDAVGDGTYEMVGRFVILDILDDSAVANATVEFSVAAVGTDGNQAMDSRTVTVVPHPNNQ